MSNFLLDSSCGKGIGNQINYGNRDLRRDMHHHIKLGGIDNELVLYDPPHINVPPLE
jgi:hypothetical protein